MYDLKKLRGSVGIATQDVFLFSDTVDGNIAYGDPEMSEDDVKRFAKIACVDFVVSCPKALIRSSASAAPAFPAVEAAYRAGACPCH